MNDGTEKVLLDDDASCMIEGPWRNINTLAHYKVFIGYLCVRGLPLRLSLHDEL
jgi:hypothetical protein